MTNTRDVIINTAFKLFLKKTFKEVTMKEIVEETGISKGAFYHHFESKEQLFFEVLNTVVTTVVTVYQKLEKHSLEQFYHDYLVYYQNLDSFFPVFDEQGGIDVLDLNVFSLFFEGIKLFPDFQKRMQECLQIELDTWKEVVRKSREMGEIQSAMSDEQIAKMFIFSSDGMSMQSIILKTEAKESLIGLWDSFYHDLKR